MRVIAGKYRGTKLVSPPDKCIRPTTDRVKETMFASIQFDIAGAHVLDLFAGSGALGIEAASRGAESVVLADRNAASLDIARQNVERLRHNTNIKIVKNDYADTMKLFQNSKKFDIVLIDPPYGGGYYQEVLEKLLEYDVLCSDAILVLESDREVAVEIEALEVWKQKKIGLTYLKYLKYKGI